MVEFICSLPDEGEFGCIIDCMLFYPLALHNVHDDYPLAPLKRKVSYEDLSPHAKKMCDHHRLKLMFNKEKLLTTFEMRRHYVLHYRNLKLYSSLGLVVSEVHEGLVFRQAPVMRDYVQFNLLHHSQAQNDFDVDFYKLLSNSLFGKTNENPEKRTKVNLCRMKEELESNVGKATFKRSKIIDQHLVGIEMKYASVKLNKPYNIGVAILELAKCHMYDFHYNLMKSVFEGCLCLLYTNMDSLLYKIEDCSDPYSEIFAAGHGSHFDLSNFPQEHRLHDISHKCVPGAFKDECGGSTYISKFVSLHSKMYSLLFDNGSTQTCTELKVAKGVKSCVIQTSLAFNDYIHCMLEDEVMEHSFKRIRSVAHDVHTIEQSKVSLSRFDDKCYLFDAVHSVPYGHYRFFHDGCDLSGN